MDNKVVNFAVNNGVMDVLHYGACEEKIFDAQASECGYKRISTFYSDLSIAEWFGINEVKDTYNRVLKSWKSDVKMFTEFVLSLNWKSWAWYARDYEELSRVYADLYQKAHNIACETYKGNDLAYYLQTTD